jgi:hypothetical protein
MTNITGLEHLHAYPWSHPAKAATERTAVTDIEPGVVLVKSSLALPEGVCTSPGKVGEWNMLATRSPEFEERLQGSEWRWPHYVPEAVASGWGITAEGAANAASNRLLHAAESARMNSAEISSVTIKNFLGWKRATVRAELRNLQRGPFLRELDLRGRRNIGNNDSRHEPKRGGDQRSVIIGKRGGNEKC